MGANSKQGWYLLLFLVGFTFLVAGLVYLGPIFSLFGLGLSDCFPGRILPHQASGTRHNARDAVRGASGGRVQAGACRWIALSRLSRRSRGKPMKVLGLLIAVLGWLIAVSSVELSGVVVQTFVAVFGLLVALGGVLGVLNGAHLKNAIWKS